MRILQVIIKYVYIYHVSRDTKSYLPLLLPVLLLTLSLTSSGIPSKRVLIPQWIAVSRLAVVVEIVQKVLKIRFAVFFFMKNKDTSRINSKCVFKKARDLSTEIIRKKLTFRAWWTLKMIIIKAEIAVYKLFYLVLGSICCRLLPLADAWDDNLCPKTILYWTLCVFALRCLRFPAWQAAQSVTSYTAPSMHA